ncbi:glycoside hydrolase 3 protein [Dispira parvispora]|uniref:glucan endo-1,3-beta-D-glucosidase n=1 Tax=Dispira parvispora TaxID=1520584 RepID=A0A9W8AQ92_9FUNG|nr:glycoside hydrolase 3 protein [Dispira parvispora]
MKVSYISLLVGSLLVGSAMVANAGKCPVTLPAEGNPAEDNGKVDNGTTTGNSTETVPATGRELYGLNYNVRKADGNCPSLEEVKADLATLSTVSKNFRIYSLVDCNQGELMLQAVQDTDYKVVLGIWVGSAPEPVATEMAQLETLAQNYGDQINKYVKGLVVGSEAVYREDVTQDVLIGYINQARTILRNHQHDTSVSAAETYDKWNGGLVDAVDYVTMNAFPFWENKTIDEAKSVFFEHFQMVSGMANGKTVVTGETGWPSEGGNYGPGVPSLDNMKRYLGEFACEAKKLNMEYYWFSGFDEPWKHDEHSIGVETHWGLTLGDRKTWKIDGPFYEC